MAILNRLASLASPDIALRRAVQLAERGKEAEAFPLLAVAARAGIGEAEYRVGRAYLEGAGVPPSRSEGAYWLERAATHNHVEAQGFLAALYVSGLAAPAAALSASASDRLFERVPAAGEPDFKAALAW